MVEIEAINVKSSEDQQIINDERQSKCKPLKCRSWNAQNETATFSELTSKLKSSSDAKGLRSLETASLEHTYDSSRGTSSKSSKIHRDTLTIPKMGKLHEVSKCCRPSTSSKNDNFIDRKCEDVGCSQNEDFHDCKSICSHKVYICLYWFPL